MNYKIIGSIGLIAILGIAAMTTTTIAFALPNDNANHVAFEQKGCTNGNGQGSENSGGSCFHEGDDEDNPK